MANKVNAARRRPRPFDTSHVFFFLSFSFPSSHSLPRPLLWYPSRSPPIFRDLTPCHHTPEVQRATGQRPTTQLPLAHHLEQAPPACHPMRSIAAPAQPPLLSLRRSPPSSQGPALANKPLSLPPCRALPPLALIIHAPRIHRRVAMRKPRAGYRPKPLCLITVLRWLHTDPLCSRLCHRGRRVSVCKVSVVPLSLPLSPVAANFRQERWR